MIAASSLAKTGGKSQIQIALSGSCRIASIKWLVGSPASNSPEGRSLLIVGDQEQLLSFEPADHLVQVRLVPGEKIVEVRRLFDPEDRRHRRFAQIEIE